MKSTAEGYLFIYCRLPVLHVRNQRLGVVFSENVQRDEAELLFLLTG